MRYGWSMLMIHFLSKTINYDKNCRTVHKTGQLSAKTVGLLKSYQRNSFIISNQHGDVFQSDAHRAGYGHRHCTQVCSHILLEFLQFTKFQRRIQSMHADVFISIVISNMSFSCEVQSFKVVIKCVFDSEVGKCNTHSIHRLCKLLRLSFFARTGR